MANFKVDFHQAVKPVKAMHGVGQPPLTDLKFSMFHYLKDAGIPYARLHDVGGFFGEGLWVDIPNLFRDFDANPYDPDSYDFAFTDLLINALIENGVEPYFRLGVTIENYAKVKAYRVKPPKDFKKWAIICEHIIRHYTEGWANGFHHTITYWEIWNEPDNSRHYETCQTWQGTKEEFFELYTVSAKHLKQKFPHLKIGGYGSCGFYNLTGSDGSFSMSEAATKYFMDFFDAFLQYIRAENAPLDFFSWHSYDAEIENNRIYAEYARKRLDEFGYSHTETSCNEWNPRVNLRGTYEHASVILGNMLMFQDTPLDNAMFYDARLGVSVYGSMFNPLTCLPFPAYYAFTAYQRLYSRETQTALEKDDPEVYALAASDADSAAIVIANPTGEEKPLSITCDGTFASCLITADGKDDEEIPEILTILPPFSILSITYTL